MATTEWIKACPVEMKQSRSILSLLLLLFALLPFQRRFHGALDSFSRKLALPDFPLPDFFSTKVHLFFTDPFILTLALILFLRFKTSLRNFFWEGPSKYLTLLFFISAISLFYSATGSYALQYFRLLEFSIIFLLFNSICCSRDKIDFPLFVHRIAWLFVGVSILQCAIGVSQYFCQHSIGLRFLGEPNLQHFAFDNPGKHRWFFDSVLGSGASGVLYRATGTFPSPNVLGGFLFCTLMATYYLCMKEERAVKRTFLLGAILLQMFTMYISFSRSALFAFALSISLWCLLQIREILRLHGLRFSAFKRLAIVCSSLLAGAVIGIGMFFSQIIARGGIFNSNKVSQFADSERMQYIKVSWGMIKEHPLLGVGFNNFQLAAERVQSEYPGCSFFAKVHNIYLLIASEVGLIGGTLFLLFLFLILKTAGQALFPRANNSATGSQEIFFLAATFIGILFIGACDYYLLNLPHGRMLFFGFAALLYVCSKTEGQSGKNDPHGLSSLT